MARQSLLLQKEKSTSEDRVLFCDWATTTIVFTQVSFLVFAWTFAGFMTRSIPLPDSTAAWIQNNPSDTQFIVALISTILALISSFCLCKIAQYALVRRLAWGPLPLTTMTEWAKLAQRTVSVNADSHKWSWTLFSVAWVSLLGFLTTAWVTLLAPQSIVISSTIQGSETNLLHPSVSSVFSDILTSSPQPPPGFNLTPGYTLNYQVPSGPLSLSSLMEAGLSATAALVNADMNKHSTTNFIGIPNTALVSNISTGGTYFSGFRFPGPFEDYRIFPGPPFDSYQGLSRSFSAIQQGFTANVLCEQSQNGTAVTSNVTNSLQFSIDGDSGDAWTQDTYSWSAMCSSGVTYSTYGVTVAGNISRDVPGDNLLMASVCFGQDFNGLSNQSFLVFLTATPSSRYEYFTQTCEVTPLVTTVQVTYNADGVANITHPPLDQHPLPVPTDTYNTSTLLWYPAYVIWTMIVRSQGLGGNELADSLSTLTYQRESVIAPIIEHYLCGMIEYIGSTLKFATARYDTPAEMIFQSNGTLYVQTFGWSFHLHTHAPSLVAITSVALLTMALGVFAMLPIPLPRSSGPAWGDTWNPLNPFARFNPAVTMDVLLASTVGDLSKVLTESGAEYHRRDEDVGVGVRKGDKDGAGAMEGARRMRERLGVMLETTGEGWPALRTVTLDAVTVDCADVGLHGLQFLRHRRGGKANAGEVQRGEYVELGEMPKESATEVDA